MENMSNQWSHYINGMTLTLKSSYQKGVTQIQDMYRVPKRAAYHPIRDRCPRSLMFWIRRAERKISFKLRVLRGDSW